MPTPTVPTPWLALDAAARAARVSRAQLLALIRAHRVPARLVDGRRWFVPRHALAEIRHHVHGGLRRDPSSVAGRSRRSPDPVGAIG